MTAPIRRQSRALAPVRRRGLVLMALLIMLVLVGVSALTVTEFAATARAREQESQMLWVGEQYRAAIERYWKATPGLRKILPTSVDQLLLDDRFPSPVRHLREKYADPFDPSQELELIKWNNAIVGVHSTVERTAMKRSNFPPRYYTFEGAESTVDWRFVFQPPTTVPGAANPSAGPAPASPSAFPSGFPSSTPPARR